MANRVLVETGFLIALNPRDRHHAWALEVLEKARKKEISLHISPIAFIELSLILKSYKRSDEDIYRLLNAIQTIINRYTRVNYPVIKLKHIMYSAKLRTKYTDLSFFDSIHASIAILDNLIYYDLDDVVKKIVDQETSR